MIKINPDKIKQAEIVVGIPSYNEADTIANVVEQVDKGLRKYFENKSAVIINSDNNSLDKTREVFLSTKTKTPKIYISTSSGVKGKGNNLRNLFSEIKNLKAKAAITVDADLKSITPEWMRCLISPIIKGYDYLTPLYSRDKYDGSITNHLCYPLIYGLLGYNIRQPIGGDMAFSDKLVRYWLNSEWTSLAKGYGIDIFMTLNAVKSGYKLGEVDLGSKIHKPSAPKLDNMFLEVSGTLFRFLNRNKNLWHKNIKLKQVPVAAKLKSKPKYSKIAFNYKEMEKKAFSEFKDNYMILKPYLTDGFCFDLEEIFFKKKLLKIDNEFWSKIVYQLLFIYQNNPKKKKEIIKLLRALYFGRTVSFAKETLDKSQKEAEKIIQKQAHCFFKKKDYLFFLTQGI